MRNIKSIFAERKGVPEQCEVLDDDLQGVMAVYSREHATTESHSGSVEDDELDDCPRDWLIVAQM